MNIRRVVVLAGPLIILVVFGCLFRGGVTAQEPFPSVFQLQPFLSGLTSPILLTNAGDGTNRIFIAEQGGIIKVVQPGSITPTVFLNITSKVLSGGERGLLGLAFHPQYSTNRRFFVHYSRQPDGVNVIAEYKASLANPNVADTAETIYLTIPQPFGNHNGGMIEFGPDGFLYIAKGDGGSANDPGNRAQNINELLGKVLRIDIDTLNGPVPYSSPPTNPFFGATPGLDEIYALGLRNPWRFSFDRSTGQLYLGDVGQGAREEVDIITLGGNYGWRVFEGTGCTGLDPSLCGSAGFTLPIAEYSHAGGRCSITGGYVYRGTAGSLPAGTYVYADFCTGEIFTFPGSSTTPVLDTTLNISSFGEDEAGELYVVSLGGTVHRLTDSGCGFSISPSSQVFSSAGGSGSIQVTTQPGCLWTATTAANFITINSAGGTGSGMATYSVSSNPNSTLRSGTITVAGLNFTVNQAGLTGSCVSSITPASLSVPASGGSGGTTVGAPTGCSWSAVSNDSWIT
ncbi:MAG TPA: PQQ-dependent sugar dehydrogenase, partial [Blastocatellia bacterium]|nr:PQQ-dependent sugar dehydrogenase [Blastocatellia bacterium]